MFNSVFNELGVAWTAAALGTLLVPVALLLAWRTARLAAETPAGRRFHRALMRAFPTHQHSPTPKALPAYSGDRRRARNARRRG